MQPGDKVWCTKSILVGIHTVLNAFTDTIMLLLLFYYLQLNVYSVPASHQQLAVPIKLPRDLHAFLLHQGSTAAPALDMRLHLTGTDRGKQASASSRPI